MYTENETNHERMLRKENFRLRRSVDLEPLKSVGDEEEKTIKTNQVNIEYISRVFVLSVMSARFGSCFATRKDCPYSFHFCAFCPRSLNCGSLRQRMARSHWVKIRWSPRWLRSTLLRRVRGAMRATSRADHFPMMQSPLSSAFAVLFGIRIALTWTRL